MKDKTKDPNPEEYYNRSLEENKLEGIRTEWGTIDLRYYFAVIDAMKAFANDSHIKKLPTEQDIQKRVDIMRELQTPEIMIHKFREGVNFVLDFGEDKDE